MGVSAYPVKVEIGRIPTDLYLYPQSSFRVDDYRYGIGKTFYPPSPENRGMGSFELEPFVGRFEGKTREHHPLWGVSPYHVGLCFVAFLSTDPKTGYPQKEARLQYFCSEQLLVGLVFLLFLVHEPDFMLTPQHVSREAVVFVVA